jgi:dihydropyrimidinase
MTNHDLTIRNGWVVTPCGMMRADIGVMGERIVTLAESLPPGRDDVDANGLPVIPGGVDTHAHVEQLGSPASGETFASASLSALYGGTTTIITHARQERGTSLRHCVEDYAARARASLADYAFHLLVTDVTPVLIEKELPELVAAGHTSVKIFMATRANALDDAALLRLMAACRTAGALVIAHAENIAAMDALTETLAQKGHIGLCYNDIAKPVAIEREAIHRFLTYAELLDTRVHIFHVTSLEALDEILRARRRGVDVSAETCPQYLIFTGEDLSAQPDDTALARLIFGPPPRAAGDREALWSALGERKIDIVSSDHSPHPLHGPGGKLEGARKGGFPTTPHGIPGLETRMPLLYSNGVATGRLSLERFAELAATGPARRFGLFPRKGALAVGSDADIVVWDPEKTVAIANAKLHHGVDYTPYEGREVRGWPRTVIGRGKVLVDGARTLAEPGRGKWLHRISPMPRSRDIYG